MSDKEIRVRIAPSPSGNLHVGTARTALFNFLFAKKCNGKFILRIEDTDLERTEQKYIQNIYDSLKAMGLNWDEGPDVGGEYGPYMQSQRFDRYKKYADKLIESGHAYYCWCTQEELEAEKAKSKEEKKPSIYSRKCLNLTPEQVEKYKAEGRIPTLRFKVPEGEIKFNDLIKGELTFDAVLMGDFVIMKSNGIPTYNFAVVIDDMEMKISHIIRGEDHISNTPKQIFIYNALGAQIPDFAHVGMILAPDKTKLSKRHGATAVSEFIQQGYLPEAFVNFVSLLGWYPNDGQEIKSLDELIQAFSIEGISSSNTIFEFDKLNWMNGQYIRSLPISDITKRALPYFEKYDLSKYSQEKLEAIVAAVREPLTTLSEITDAVAYFFEDNVEIEEEVNTKAIDNEDSQKVLKEFILFAQNLSYNDVEKIHEELGFFRTSIPGLKAKQIMWPIRACLTGRLKGADMGAIINILGKDTVIKRAEASIKN